MKLFHIFIYTLIYFMLSVILQAQNSEFLETEGTDFWLTFMPNAHNADNAISTDSLHIYVTSKTPTKGKIYYSEFRPNNNVVPKEIDFEITQPNEVYHFAAQFFYTELRGDYCNGASAINEAHNNEVVCRKSFHITTVAKSTVYVLNYASVTADACIVLPTPALGKEYYIMSYNSCLTASANLNCPSQFAIVGVKDNTQIEITPSSKTYWNGMNKQTIKLNKGDVYLVQNKIEDNTGDMTGSYIIADKEIAVFAGHQRTSIPVEYGQYGGSRDCLIEQMLPVSCWGRNAIITPFAVSLQNQPSSYKNIFRVLAAKDNTKIYVDGSLVATINKGQYYQSDLKAAVVSSNNPIMVASYMKTESKEGDPAMLIMPPVEQYKNSYTIINAQFDSMNYNHTQRSPMIKAQYLNIIVPEEVRDSVYIDGNLLSTSNFIQIGESDYYYAMYESTDGTHNINCSIPICVICYGYGYAISYGYLGGMAMRDIEDINLVISTDTCYQKFQITYTEPFHSGIKSFEIVDTINAKVTIKRQSKWKIIWDLEKRDNTKKSIISIKITDIYGKDTVYSDTIGAKSIAISNTNDAIDFEKVILGNIDSTHINIINRGTETIELTDKNFKLLHNTNFTISKSVFPINIQATDTVMVTIYYAPTKKSKSNDYDTDTLFIENDCFHYVIPLIGEPTPDTLKINSVCDVSLIAVADSIDVSFAKPIVAPNPLNSNTITYNFPVFSDSDVSIKIFDATGKMCRVNFSGYLQKGVYEIIIDVNDLSPGIYFINIEADEYNYSNNLIKH